MNGFQRWRRANESMERAQQLYFRTMHSGRADPYELAIYLRDMHEAYDEACLAMVQVSIDKGRPDAV